MMRLYDGGRVPNARRVRIFLSEKGITLPLVPVDLGKKEHQTPEFLARNPLGRVPVLELEDGTFLSESIAICRYLEALHPEPALFGTTPLQQAQVEMWNRRVEFELYIPVQAVFRHLHPGMAGYEVPQIPQWGEVNKPRVLEFLTMLDAHCAQSPFIAGDFFSIADISAFITVDFMKAARLAVPEHLPHLRRWHAACAARPSASA
jgi:glutathione S-transferase